MVINAPHMQLRNTPKVSLNGYYMEFATSYKHLGFCIYEINDDQDL